MDYQGVISKTYYCGNIETDHCVIYSMPEDVTNNPLPNLTYLGPRTLKKVLEITQQQEIKCP